MPVKRSDTVDLLALPTSVQAALDSYIRENGPLPNYSLASVMDAYLRWHGILGYTAGILSIVEAVDHA